MKSAGDGHPPRTILILATLDTKEEEVLFLRERVRQQGHKAMIVDAGVLEDPQLKPDVSRQEVAAAGGLSVGAMLSSGNKGKCIRTMIAGAAVIVKTLFDQGKFHGIISVGGAQGAAIGAAAMRTLPFGLPK